ncbi:MAG: hypothetical protein ACREXX_16660 [Gammaproteobacteria bacterium]
MNDLAWKYGTAHRQLFEPESGEEDPHRGCAHGGTPDAVSEVIYIKRV